MRHIAAIILTLVISVTPSCNYIKNNGLFGRKSKAEEARVAFEKKNRFNYLKIVSSRSGPTETIVTGTPV